MQEYDNSRRTTSSNAQDILVQGFMPKVYTWMSLGLLLTAGIAYLTLATPAIFRFLFSSSGIPFYVLLFAELGMVMYLSARITKLSTPTAMVLFFLYAASNGLTLSPLLFAYTQETVYNAFFTTAAMFGGMSVYGTLTKRDLTGLGPFCMMGLWGLLAAMIVNFFVHSSQFSLGISLIAVVVFVLLTAYDTQKLRAMAQKLADDERLRGNFAIYGALELYLDFINIFIHLLRIFGRKK